MGWTVLYIAFGVVALWLLGEVLLQYKARLRWRLLAFVGFLGVVLGVLMPSVPVIAVGATAFAVGQTYVTLSFRRGFSTGWALGGKPGASRRRRSAAEPEREPTLEVSDLSYESADEQARPAPEVYEPEPLPEDTGQYGVYSDDAYAASRNRTAAHDDSGAPQYDTGYGAYDAYADPAGPQPDHTAAYPAYDTADASYQYTGYQDPYAGAQQQYDAYGTYATDGAGYATAAYPDPYAQQQYGDTPPGGVWVPQQRENDEPPAEPRAQPSPYGYDTGYDGQQQYRY
ncbi:hypothetical protein [Streptomyces sp. NPDC005805]|uniref:hypothetical protein n=1 Tax=Streptomyces sp. NPDC005805 TaxID=3157068 RepID=UPI00340C16A6